MQRQQYQRGNQDRGGRGGRPFTANNDYSGGQSQLVPGQAVPCSVNYFKMQSQNKKEIHLYKIDWGQLISEAGWVQSKAFSGMRDKLEKIFGGKKSYFRCENYLLTMTNAGPEFNFETGIDKGNYEIRLTHHIIVDLNDLNQDTKEYLRFVYLCFNSVVKEALRQKDFFQIGKFPTFYNQKECKWVDGYNIKAWAGYELMTKPSVQGIFLNVDCRTKFINGETIYESINKQLKNGKTFKQIADIYDSSNINNPRVVVITSHNSRQYQVDGLTKDLNPQTYKFQDRDGKEISMWQYFLKCPKGKIEEFTDREQPLLYVNKPDGRIYLPVQLCQRASLPDDFTEDRQKMAHLQNYKVGNAQQRFEKTIKMLQQFRNDATFEQWGLDLDYKPATVHGKLLAAPQVITPKGELAPVQDFFKMKVPTLQPLKLEAHQYSIVYDDKQTDIVNCIHEKLKDAAKGLQMAFKGSEDDVRWVVAPNQARKANDYIAGMQDLLVKDKCDPTIEFALVIIRDKNIKKDIKRWADSKGIITQFLLIKGQRDVEMKKMGVWSNLLRQINAKCGKDLYRIQMSKQVTENRTMFIGLDVVNHRVKSIVGLAATESPHFTQHYTEVHYHDLPKDFSGKKKYSKEEQEQKICGDRANILSNFILNALENYRTKNNGQVPKQLVIYRDGVGGPSFLEKCLQLEGPGGQLEKAISEFQPNYKPKLLYIIINNRTSTRIFQQDGNSVRNPGKGTVVDSVVVENEGKQLFDFYMVSNDNPPMATALPVHYRVAMNTSDMSKKEIEEMVYHQSYAYYGFGGPVKVPATAFYAHKLANYVYDNGFSGTNLNTTPSAALAHKLHFL